MKLARLSTLFAFVLLSTSVRAQVELDAPAAVAPTPLPSAAAAAPLALEPSLAAPASASSLFLPANAAAPAVSVRASAAAASAEPSAPAAAAPASERAVPPRARPEFAARLIGWGVDEPLVDRLQAFLAANRPGDKALADHSQEVAAVAAGLAERAGLAPGRAVLLTLSAALHGVDPERTPEARALIRDFGASQSFTPEQVRALILATDFSPDPAAMAEKSRAFEGAARAAFHDDWGLVWGRRLALAEQIVARRDAASPAPERAPPADPDLAAARRYIRSIAAGVRLDERQTDSLLGDYLAENAIPPASPRAQALRRALVPARAAAEEAALAPLKPALRRHGAAVLALAREYETTPAEVQAALERRGAAEELASLSERDFRRQADLTLRRDELQRAVAGYPRTAAGDLMRAIADAMAARSGKSVEEVARDGVFVYADFAGTTLLRAWTGRDPDTRAPQVVFYATRDGARWRFVGYRQNRPQGRPDADYTQALERWLSAGGVPAADLR